MKDKKLSPAEQAAREEAILNAPPDPSNKAVEALLSPEFEQMSNLDVSQIALLLQELVRGQNSLLARYEDTSVQIAKLRERQDQADQEIAARLEANQKFVEEVMDRAESIKRTGEAHDKLIAQGVAEYQKAVTKARATRAANDLAFKEKLMKEEKVTIISPGQLITTMEHGQQVSKIVPEEVHIKNIHMAIPVGRPVEVPRTIANYLEERRKSKEETARRQEILSKHMEASKLAEEWGKIGGSKTDHMPI